MPRLSKIGDLTTMVLIGFLIDILLGPPHRSRSTGLSQVPRSRPDTFSLIVKILMCSHERPGWSSNRDLSFCDGDLGKRNVILSI